MASLNKKGSIGFGPIVATIGSILIGLGIIWLIAQNWHEIPSFVKIIILLVATAGAYVGGVFLRINGYPKTASSVIFLGSLLFCSSVFLISQIYSTDTDAQGYANLFLLCILGVMIIAYTLHAASSLVLGFILSHVWLVVQFFALYDNNRWYNEPNWGVLMLLFLAMGIIVYGLGLMERSRESAFAKIYLFWTAFYMMLFAYFLTFQGIIPTIWRAGLKASSTETILLLVFGILSIISIVSGLFIGTSNSSDKK